VRLSSEVLRDAGVEVAPASRGVLQRFVDLGGEVAASPDRVARIASPVAGRVERVFVEEGQYVRRGDPLLVVRVPDLGRLRADHRGALSKAHAARANADRLASLVADRLAARQAWLDAEAQARSLEAEAASLGQQLAAIGADGAAHPSLLTLRARVSGVVLSRSAVAGQPVTTDQPLGTVADLAEVWFMARVFERDLGAVVAGARAEVRVEALPGRRFAAVVDDVAPQVDPATRAVNVRIRVPNPDGALRVGLAGTARIVLPEAAAGGPPAVLVPESALAVVDGRRLVFVEVGDGDFVPRPVLVGRSAWPTVEIRDGLEPGERVAVRGVYTLEATWLRRRPSE
jgi:cobalt-zinc-cadmium efflux system membrane fusion protein